MLRKLIAATTLPVTVERAKARLRVDTTDNDADLERLILAAASAVEVHTGRILAVSSWEYRLDCWPGCEPISIPAAPIRDVTDVVYLDEVGAEQAIVGTDWYWDRTAEGADVGFISGYSTPTLYERPGSLRVRFVAGYDEPDAVPVSGDDPELAADPQIELALLFLVGTWFALREHVQADPTFKVPDTFEFLANQLRIFR